MGFRSTKELPSEADVIVVGSGITGAFAARELVARGRRVALLDAREVCWGATGRNGGHCQPDMYGQPHHISRFEFDTFRYVRDFVALHKVPCDWEAPGTVQIIDSEELLDLIKFQKSYLQSIDPEMAAEFDIVEEDGSEHLQVHKGPRALILKHSGGRLAPYKLVTWIVQQLVKEEAFNLQTNTPVTELTYEDEAWVAHTLRGTIRAKDVLLATNAYTSHLLPEFTQRIVPVRAQASALSLPSGGKPLDKSYIWDSGTGDDYLIQRPCPDHSLVFGGERFLAPDRDVGNWKDDSINEDIARGLRRAVPIRLQLRPDGMAEEKELGATHEWTGITGGSSDGYPWVGRVPDEMRPAGAPSAEGLWIAAGFSGHGMPVTARCAVAVAGLMTGQETGVELPPEYVASAERAKVESWEAFYSSYVEDMLITLRAVKAKYLQMEQEQV